MARRRIVAATPARAEKFKDLAMFFVAVEGAFERRKADNGLPRHLNAVGGFGCAGW